MRAEDLDGRLAAALKTRAGWRRHRERPFCFVHATAGLQILVIGTELALLLGDDQHTSEGMAVVTKAAYYPNGALAAMLEVIDALVLKRAADARRAALVAANSQTPGS